MSPVVEILLLTLGICAVVGTVGLLLLWRWRAGPTTRQLVVVALLPVVAVAVTVVVHVRLMFLSGHDSGVVLLALATAVVLAALGTTLVARHIAEGWVAVTRGLRSLAADVDVSSPVEDLEPPAGSALETTLAELERTRSALADARARERAVEAARRELVAFMSHDLRTPLAGIRAVVEGVEDGVIDDVAGAMSSLRTSTGRMARLVDDLFELSRVQGGAVVHDEGLVSLREVLLDVTSEAAPAAERRSVGLDVDVPEDDRLAVVGSADDLSRALGNLVANAVRHTECGSRVGVHAWREAEGRVHVDVADACGGIPDEALARVFDAGWRGSADGEQEHAGLGLAIARGVVESHAGRIAVANAGKGCRFQVVLPAPEPGIGTA